MKPWLSEEMEHLFQQIHQLQLRIICISSCNQKCGSSTMSYWLAERCSENQTKVLLIDLDLSGSGQGYEAIHWETENKSKEQPLIKKHQYLDILAQPEDQSTVLTLRQPHKLRYQLQYWQQHYHYIICDTGNINTANWRNLPAVNIANASDGILLCLSAAKTTESQLLTSIAKLEKSNCNIIGIIINDQFNPTLAQRLLKSMNSKAWWLPEKIRNKITAMINKSQLLQGKYQ
ncbi:hypothetical protein [Photobacterium leiognathi]|uniref:Chromosome partitioning protein ParA n=1 Tax=Photobacterium leiognathi subsp. mandapamensis TaxID=48408 RepID=A0A2T3KY76_PHOLD|nr:hypothetical protein [Photobacterium leiognathi]PSV12593.1 hypothetical protein C0W93_06075 [Photobacterium leiognathi subsp. mandapamensis]